MSVVLGIGCTSVSTSCLLNFLGSRQRRYFIIVPSRSLLFAKVSALLYGQFAGACLITPVLIHFCMVVCTTSFSTWV